MNIPEKMSLAAGLRAELADILRRYSETDTRDMEAFMTAAFQDAGVYASPEEAAAVAVEISTTIDAIHDGHREIQGYKQRGLSSAIWLRDKLDKGTAHLPQEERDAVVSSVKGALASSNSELVKLLTEDGEGAALVAKLTSPSFQDLNKTAVANNLKDEIQANTLLGAVVLEAVPVEPEEAGAGLGVVRRFFESDLGDEGEKNFKKVVAAGIEIAKKKGKLPDILTKASPAQVALLADQAATTAKVAYKVGTGKMKIEEGTDYLIDTAVSRVGVLVSQVCAKAGAAIGAKVGAAVGLYLAGPAGMAVGANIGRVVGYMAGEAVGDAINTGVKKIAPMAKKAVRTLCGEIKSFASSACRAISNLFS